MAMNVFALCCRPREPALKSLCAKTMEKVFKEEEHVQQSSIVFYPLMSCSFLRKSPSLKGRKAIFLFLLFCC